MSGALREEDEEAWLRVLNSFDRDIWPALFEGRGYTKGEALIFWRLCRLDDALDALNEKMTDRDDWAG